MAASSSHPLLTKSIHGGQKGSIQMLDSSLEEESIQAIRGWCTLHKTDKHSDSDCLRATGVCSANRRKKKRSTGIKKGSKPRRLSFKSSNNRKKFLRSIEEMEGVSLDDSSNEDDSNVVEPEFDTTSHHTPLREVHTKKTITFTYMYLCRQPGNVLEEDDVVMEEVDALCANQNSPDETLCANQNSPDATRKTKFSYACPNCWGKRLSSAHMQRTSGSRITLHVVKISIASNYASLRSSDAALLDGPGPSEVPTPLPKIPKVEENPYSPDPCLLDLDINTYLSASFTSRTRSTTGHRSFASWSSSSSKESMLPTYVPPPHNVVVSTSSIPMSTSGSARNSDGPQVSIHRIHRWTEGRVRICNAWGTTLP